MKKIDEKNTRADTLIGAAGHEIRKRFIAAGYTDDQIDDAPVPMPNALVKLQFYWHTRWAFIAGANWQQETDATRIADLEKRVQYHLTQTDLVERITELEAMLRRLEWAEYDGMDYCPVCYGDKEPHGKHKPGCELAALLDAREVLVDGH